MSPVGIPIASIFSITSIDVFTELNPGNWSAINRSTFGMFNPPEALKAPLIAAPIAAIKSAQLLIPFSIICFNDLSDN